MAVLESDLVVEDGNGLVDANAYIDFAFADEYHRLRDNTLWAESTENDKASSIIRATQYIDERFCFKGEIVNPEDQAVDPDPPDGPQALQWGRDWIYDRNGVDVSYTVPVEIQEATAEYALRVLGDGGGKVQLQPDPVQDDPFQPITLKREKVGPLEEETRYDTSLPLRTIQPYPAADTIIWNSGYAKSGAGRTVR